MSSRSASALLDAALAVPFDPEEEDRRQLALAANAQWEAAPLPDQQLDIAPEAVDMPPPLPQIGPDPLIAEADAAMLDANGEPPLPQADEDLPPVVAPSGGGGRRSASALLADIPEPEQRTAEPAVPTGDQALARRSAAALLADIPEESSMLRRAGDVPIFIAQGITTGLKGISDAFGAQNAVSQGLAGNQEFYQDLLSPEAQASQQRVAQIQQEAQDQGFGAQVAAAGRAFAESPTAFIAQGVGTMAPTIVTGAAGKALGLGARGVQAVQAATGATMGGGIVKGEIYQAVEQAMLQAGRSPEEAAAKAAEAQAYGGENKDQILAGLGLGFVATAIGAERLAGRAIAGAAGPTGGVLRVAARTALQEGLPEAAQGGQEQLARNLAQQREGFEVPTMRGVAGAGALEGLAGLAIGGPAGVASSVGSRVQPGQSGTTATSGVASPWQAAREGVAPMAVEVVDDGVFGEPTTAAVPPTVTGDERFAPPPAAAEEQRTAGPAVPTEETLFGDVEQRGETIVTPPPATDSALVETLPTVELPVQELQLSRDVPNFKEGADAETGVVEGERLEGEFKRLGMAPIIVWERQDGRREIISGRHRWDLAKRTKQETIPAQVVREADGFNTQDALTLDAELNIRDGQGSVKDYANYFRTSQIDRAAATERGLLSRTKGRAGFEIGRSGSNDLYAAFANNAVSADKAAAIAAAAPQNETLQRAALSRAGNMTADQLGGFVRALSARVTAAPETQTDLFGADDSALVQAEQLSKAANAKARQLQEQITAVRAAVRRPEAARKMGVDVRDPEGIKRKITELEGQVRKYQEFYANPDVMAELQATTRVAEEPGDLPLAGLPAQDYFNFADVPKSKQQEGQQAIDAAASTPDVPYAEPAVSARPRVDRSGELASARERQAAAYRALLGGDAQAVADAIQNGVPLSRLMLEFISREPASFNIRGAILKTPRDLAMYNLAHRTPFFESLKIAVVDTRNQVIASQVVSVGTVNQALAHPRDILAVIEAARANNPKTQVWGFMVMHNHPSGDPLPSQADVTMTRTLIEAAERIGVQLIDHVVTNGESFYSFRENGLITYHGTPKQIEGTKPARLKPLRKPEDRMTTGNMSPWEVVPTSEARTTLLSGPAKLQQIQQTLQTADPNMMHVINVDTKYAIISVDRYPMGTKPGDAVKNSITQGTYAAFVSLPPMPEVEARSIGRQFLEVYQRTYQIPLLDVMAYGTEGLKNQGLLEQAAPYGGEPGDVRVAEEAPRGKPRQLEEKARANAALAPETRERLGSQYIPISLNAQATEAKDWINTNGLEAAKLRIAALAGDDTVPTPLDFAIGIEAAGRLSATGDHAGAAAVVGTMSRRATSMGQTVAVLAMMARLTPEGIVLYGEQLVRRYVDTLPAEAQERIKALQAEVERLRATLAEMKFKEGSEVIRSGKLGDEKIQDRLKRRVKARVQADLGPAASGPEVTAETKSRTQGLNRKVRDVLLSDSKRAEMTAEITRLLQAEGNMSPSEAEAVAKSIVNAFTKIVGETRRKYVEGAKRGAGRGAQAARFDRLLKLLQDKPEMSDGEFVAEVSQLMGLPGMTPELARELRQLGQRYERATDPEVKLVLAALMFERAHEIVPADFWVKVRAFSYLSMLFAPKTWIRNVIGNQIQWIANVGRDAFVATVMDPAMALLTGKRTTAGLKLGARLRGLLAPVEDVRRGYLWSKQENPEFNFRQNFMAGVNHLRVLSKLTTQNKFEIADVRNVGARIFSSRLMRLWEGALSIALGAGDRAFWMSQYRASLAQMQAAAERNGEWTGQPTPEMIEAAQAEAMYAIYQNANLLSANMNKIRGALNRLTTFGRTDQFGLGTALTPFTQVPGSLTLRGLIEWSPLGMIPALYRGMRGILYATTTGRHGAKFDQAAFNKEFTQALIGAGGMYAAGYYLYALGVITASREDDDDLEAMRRASGKGAYRINLTALRRALLSGNWFTRQEGEEGDLIVPYDWAQPVAITVAAGAEFAAQVERANREQLKKGLVERAGMAALSLVAGAKSLEELPLLSGLSSFMKTWGYAGPLEATLSTIAGVPSMFVPQLVRQGMQLSDNMVRETRGGDSMVQREFMKVLASVPGYSTKFPVRFDITGKAIERYQYGGNTVANVLMNPALSTRMKSDPVLAEIGRLVDATGDASPVPRQVKRRTKINGVDVDLTNDQLAAYQFYLGNFTMSHFTWRMAAPVYARLPDEVKVKMLAQDLTDIDAAVKSAVLGADMRRLTRTQMFLRQALVNSPLGQSVPPR